MENRSVGNSGLSVSRMGLGTMTWGRDTDEQEAADQLRLFLDSGGNFLDTAALYGDGDSERVLGGLIEAMTDRDEVVIATKAGISLRNGERVVDNSRKTLLLELDKSLARLNTDYVDIWQIHSWDSHVPLEETLGALDTAVSSGKARYVGISNFNGWQTSRAVTLQNPTFGHAPIVSVQNEYSLLNRKCERVGLKNFTLHITSLGDRASRDSHRVALNSFIDGMNLDEETKLRATKNPLRLFDDKRLEIQKQMATAPLLVDFLSSESLDNFHAVKESLQSIGIPFEVNPRMVRGLDYYTGTTFEFVLS